MLLLLTFACSNDPGQLMAPDLTNVPLDGAAVSLTAVNDSIPADGKTYAEIVVKAVDSVVKKYRQVSLEISAPGKFNNGLTQIQSPFDGKGEVHVFVLASDAAITNVKASIEKVTKTIVLKFYKVQTDTLKVYLVKDSIAADSYSYAELVAVTRKADIPSGSRQLTFTSDKGTFSNGSPNYVVQAAANDTTRALLKHNRAEVVRVNVTIDNYSREQYIHFVTSWPRQMFIEPGTNVLGPLFTSKAIIKALLIRMPGSVSPGLTVKFYDSTTNNKHIGAFFNTSVTNDQGECSTEYWLQDTSYTGLVYIKGEIQTDTGKVIGINRIVIQK